MSAAALENYGTAGTKTSGMTQFGVGMDTAKPAPKVEIDRFDRWTIAAHATSDCSWVTICCDDLTK